MEGAKKTAFPVVGAIFLGLALFKFLQGDNWIVWLILGALFGGFGIFRAKKGGA